MSTSSFLVLLPAVSPRPHIFVFPTGYTPDAPHIPRHHPHSSLVARCGRRREQVLRLGRLCHAVAKGCKGGKGSPHHLPHLPPASTNASRVRRPIHHPLSYPSTKGHMPTHSHPSIHLPPPPNPSHPHTSHTQRLPKKRSSSISIADLTPPPPLVAHHNHCFTHVSRKPLLLFARRWSPHGFTPSLLSTLSAHYHLLHYSRPTQQIQIAASKE